MIVSREDGISFRHPVGSVKPVSRGGGASPALRIGLLVDHDSTAVSIEASKIAKTVVEEPIIQAETSTSRI